MKEIESFLIPTLILPSVKSDKTLIPVLNSSSWSVRIVEISAEIGAELKAEIKIDLGLSDGFAIIS